MKRRSGLPLIQALGAQFRRLTLELACDFVIRPGPYPLRMLHVEFRDVQVFSSGNVGFIHALEKISGKMKNGQQTDMWVRATSGVIKLNGKWLIVHDHISVPADFDSGKAVLDLKP